MQLVEAYLVFVNTLWYITLFDRYGIVTMQQLKQTDNVRGTQGCNTSFRDTDHLVKIQYRCNTHRDAMCHDTAHIGTMQQS